MQKRLRRQNWYDKIYTRFQEHSGVPIETAPTGSTGRQASATQDKERLQSCSPLRTHKYSGV